MPSQIILAITAAMIAAVIVLSIVVLVLTNRSASRLNLQNSRSINRSNNSDFHIGEVTFFKVNDDI